MAGDPVDGSLLVSLESRFGPVRRDVSKPFSVHYRDADNRVLIKVYRLISPTVRQAREIEALDSVPRYGIRVPRVLDHGRYLNVAWTAIEVLAGTPLTLRTTEDVAVFVNTARSLLSPLHAQAAMSGPGHGWSGSVAPSVSDFLTSQISGRTKTLPAWPRLRDQFSMLDALPVVRLHGDVKPGHILMAAGGPPALVDWEACARGPVDVDDADIAFRVIRDLIYADVPADAIEAAVRGWSPRAAALAWRLALWLDRRRYAGTEALAPLLGRIADVPTENSAVGAALEIVGLARTLGTRY